jgi:hypothetical protein
MVGQPAMPGHLNDRGGSHRRDVQRGDLPAKGNTSAERFAAHPLKYSRLRQNETQAPSDLRRII